MRTMAMTNDDYDDDDDDNLWKFNFNRLHSRASLVIPAEAGIQKRDVIPAKAGIQSPLSRKA